MTLLQCLWYLIRHKYYVALFGKALGVSPWRLLIHDWSKLLPSQLDGYVDFYRNNYVQSEKTVRAIQDHYRRERHHWNHFVSLIENTNGSHKFICIPMTRHDVAEMVADWAAAGFAKHGYLDLQEYYESRKASMVLHAETREHVEYFIELIYNDRELQESLSGKARQLRKRLQD